MRNKNMANRRSRAGYTQDSSHQSQSQYATSDPKPTEELTPYDLIRMQNCKTSNFYAGEAYPSIRPPKSRCDPNKTNEWMSDTLEANGCARLFDMKQDDLMTVWSSSPHKESLSCYGAGTQLHAPEAVRFNQALAKSLQMASDVPQMKKQLMPVKPQICSNEPDGSYVLNRQCLQSQLDRMPTVKRKLNPYEAFNWLNCPGPVDAECPFCDTAAEGMVSLSHALNMERPPKKPKQGGPRRKYNYCNVTCGLPSNKCTEYEWNMYKLDPRPYDEAFKLWQEEQGALQMEPEPKNYDELYSRLVGCFERDPNQVNDLCILYDKCCKKEDEPNPQGCGEFGPGDDGKFGGGKDGGGGGGGGVGEGGDPGDGSPRGSKGKRDGGSKTGDGDKKKDGPGKDGGKDKSRGRDGDDEKGKKDGKDDGDKDRDGDVDKGKTDGKDGPGGKGDGKDKDKTDEEKRKKREKDEKDTEGGKGDGKDGKDKDGKDKDSKDAEDKEKVGKEKKNKDKDKEDSEKLIQRDKDKYKDLEEEPGEKEDKDKKKKDKEDKEPRKDSDKLKQYPSIPSILNDQDDLNEVPKKDKTESGKVPDTVPKVDSIDWIEDDKSKLKLKEKSPGKHHGDKKPEKEPEKVPDKGRKTKKKKPPGPKRREREKGIPDSTTDCPCDICQFMKRRCREPDSPLIRDMKRREKNRQLRDYYNQMCRREYVKHCPPVYCAPQHKCDPIVCDNSFCCNPKIAEHFERVEAMQNLQKMLRRRKRCGDSKVNIILERLKERLCDQLVDSISLGKKK